MRRWRLSDRPVKPDEDEDLKDPETRAGVKATIFLSYTSNMVSCGVRETLRFLAQHKMVDCIVTSAGGIGTCERGPVCVRTRACVRANERVRAHSSSITRVSDFDILRNRCLPDVSLLFP